MHQNICWLQKMILEKYGLEANEYGFTVCRIEPENNCHYTLEAFAESGNKLMFVGNFEHSEYAKELRAKYEKYPNISFSPCQTGQGRRFRINLAGCLEILLPMPVSEPASGAFFGKCKSVCLASTGIDGIWIVTNFPITWNTDYFSSYCTKKTSYFGENVESRFSRQIALAIPSRML